jgi:hypothetical protein
LSGFAKDRSQSDGHQFYCKACKAEQVAKWREEHEGDGSNYRYQKTWRERHPEQARVNDRINKAARRGSLEKPDRCMVCGTVGPTGSHHGSYALPQLIAWSCRDCHPALDALRRAAESRREKKEAA